MGRRVLAVGLGLVGVGLLIAILWRPPSLQAPGLPIDRAAQFLLGLLPAVGSLATVAGGVLVALWVSALATGRPPWHSHPRVLLWAGLGAWVVALLPETTGLLWLGAAGPSWPIVAFLQLAFVVQLVAAAVLALWLAGVLTSRGPAGVRVGARTVMDSDRRPYDEDERADV